MFSFYNFCKQNITNFILSQRGKMRLFGGFMPYIKLIRCKTTNKALYPRETDSSFKQFDFASISVNILLVTATNSLQNVKLESHCRSHTTFAHGN